MLGKTSLKIAVVFPIVLLAGCASEPQIVSICLPQKDYAPEWQKQLSAEIGQLKPGSALGEAIIDYEALRDANRACEAKTVSSGWGVGQFP